MIGQWSVGLTYFELALFQDFKAHFKFHFKQPDFSNFENLKFHFAIPRQCCLWELLEHFRKAVKNVVFLSIPSRNLRELIGTPQLSLRTIYLHLSSWRSKIRQASRD